MKLNVYIDLPGSKTLQAIADESGVSYQTVKAVAKGMLIVKYDVAKRISDAIGKDKKGKLFVSIADLCEDGT